MVAEAAVRSLRVTVTLFYPYLAEASWQLYFRLDLPVLHTGFGNRSRLDIQLWLTSGLATRWQCILKRSYFQPSLRVRSPVRRWEGVDAVVLRVGLNLGHVTRFRTTFCLGFTGVTSRRRCWLQFGTFVERTDSSHTRFEHSIFRVICDPCPK